MEIIKIDEIENKAEKCFGKFLSPEISEVMMDDDEFINSPEIQKEQRMHDK